ncbi:MAG: hypothetical protein ACKPJJ_21300, partial [Planctomycetaceae bacterium]
LLPVFVVRFKTNHSTGLMLTVLTMKLNLPTGGLRGIRKAVWGGGVALRGIAGDGRGGGGVVSGEPRTGFRGCEAGEPVCELPACILCIDPVAMRLVCRQLVSREAARSSVRTLRIFAKNWVTIS